MHCAPLLVSEDCVETHFNIQFSKEIIDTLHMCQSKPTRAQSLVFMKRDGRCWNTVLYCGTENYWPPSHHSIAAAAVIVFHSSFRLLIDVVSVITLKIYEMCRHI